MKTKVLALSLCLLLLAGLSFTGGTRALPSLALTLTTDQPIYRFRTNVPSTINVSGTLTSNGAPVPDGLVALTVWQGKPLQFVRPILFRTLTTGSLPSQNWNVDVSLNVGGWSGTSFVPKTVFTGPSTSANPGPVFNINCTSTTWLPKLFLTLTIFDAAEVPITTISLTGSSQSMLPNSSISIYTSEIPLVDGVAFGNATAYVSAFNNFPPYYYYPYCPEVSKQFTIKPSSGNQASNPENSPPSIPGNFNLSFEMNYAMTPPGYLPWGNYTVEAYSSYQGNYANQFYIFWVRIPGDVNGDSTVDIRDFSLVCFYWHKTVPPAPAYVDLNNDGYVDIRDLSVVTFFWHYHEQPLPPPPG